MQHDAMHLIAAKMAASARVNGDQIGSHSLAELDELTNSDMISALANIVTKGKRAGQSLSDAFANANHEFGMADRLIGGYQVTEATDQVPVGEKVEEEKEETTKIAQVEEVLPTKEVDHTKVYELVDTQSTKPWVYQLSLLAHMQPVVPCAKNRPANGGKNGHHQNGTSNGHYRNGHGLIQGDDKNRLIDPPQLEMPILHQVRSNKGSKKRRRKAYRGPSLFDWFNRNQEK